MSFLRASSKEEYSLRLAARLAKSYYDKQPISLTDVSLEEKISSKYLEELVVPLRRAKLVKASSGRGGGYIFIKNPQRVSVKDLIWLVDNDPSLTRCSHHDQGCALSKSCQVKEVWQQVQQLVEDTLDGISLAQLIK